MVDTFRWLYLAWQSVPQSVSSFFWHCVLFVLFIILLAWFYDTWRVVRRIGKGDNDIEP